MAIVDVVGMGAMNTDHLYRVDRILADGETLTEEPVSLPGGSAANTIYALAKLGLATGFIGAIGDDEEGEILLRDFQDTGVDTRLIQIKKRAKTGSALCLSDRHGRRSLYISPGANDLLDEEAIDTEYINKSRVLHLSSFAHPEQFEIQKRLVGSLAPSVRLSLAPGAIYAARGLEEMACMLKRAYVLFLNQVEIKSLTGEDFITGAEKCLRQGCHIVVVTLGGKSASCYITDGEKKYTIRPKRKHVRPVIDTTGAGDAFAAGFLYGILKGKDIEECGLTGDFMAQRCISQIGARRGLPSSPELCRKLQGHHKPPANIA